MIFDLEEKRHDGTGSEVSAGPAPAMASRRFSLVGEFITATMTAFGAAFIVREAPIDGAVLVGVSAGGAAIALIRAGLGVSSSPALRGSADIDADRVVFSEGVRVKMLAYCAFLAPLLIWGAPIADQLLDVQDAADAHLLAALVPQLFLAGLAPVVALSARSIPRRRRLQIAIATVGIAVASALLLVPRHGVVGVAVSLDAALGFYVLGHVAAGARALSLSIKVTTTVASALTSAAAMGLFLGFVGTQHVMWPDWLVGSVGGLGIYVAVLTFTYELRASDFGLAALLDPAVTPARPAADEPPKTAPMVDRLWLPAGAPRAMDDGGFLPDAGAPLAPSWLRHARRLSDVGRTSCLVLTGDAGVGKT